MSKIVNNRLFEQFKDKASFTREELFDFYRQDEPDLKEETFGWRIYDLKNKNIIKPIKRGVYTTSYKPKYKPAVSPDLIKLGTKLFNQYPEAKYCIWDTAWLNEFSQHQSSKHILIVEIEKEFVESLYYYIKDNLRLEIYLNPDEKAISFYIAESNRPVVVKKMITRSPVSKLSHKKIKLSVPMLEKMLVDLYAENKLFYFYQGAELGHIFKNAIKNYAINYTKLFSYAKRREKEQDIKAYMKKHLPHLPKDYIDD
jgi:hypothetical protein